MLSRRTASSLRRRIEHADASLMLRDTCVPVNMLTVRATDDVGQMPRPPSKRADVLDAGPPGAYDRGAYPLSLAEPQNETLTPP